MGGAHPIETMISSGLAHPKKNQKNSS